MWNWAARECAKNNEGPAFFLRNILIGAMARQNGFAPESQPARSPPRQPPEQLYGTKGKGVHQECYKDMVKDWTERYPGHDTPFASPMPEARLLTVCPKCLNQVQPGEPIMITTMSNWG
jgi:hypothetical protein